MAAPRGIMARIRVKGTIPFVVDGGEKHVILERFLVFSNSIIVESKTWQISDLYRNGWHGRSRGGAT